MKTSKGMNKASDKNKGVPAKGLPPKGSAKGSKMPSRGSNKKMGNA